MSKISMKAAAKMFVVSRPTLAKHREEGKISGEKVGDAWQFDVSELARVYQRRGQPPAPDRHADLTQPTTPPAPDLHGEIKVLQAKLEAEKEARALLERHIEDLRKLLPSPGDRPERRRWRWW